MPKTFLPVPEMPKENQMVQTGLRFSWQNCFSKGHVAMDSPYHLDIFRLNFVPKNQVFLICFYAWRDAMRKISCFSEE